MKNFVKTAVPSPYQNRNSEATQHYLSEDEKAFFVLHFIEIQKQIDEIVRTNHLEGQWELAGDSGWLIRRGEN
jgi:hypothetical protein